jgi:hypothetical protein
MSIFEDIAGAIASIGTLAQHPPRNADAPEPGAGSPDAYYKHVRAPQMYVPECPDSAATLVSQAGTAVAMSPIGSPQDDSWASDGCALGRPPSMSERDKGEGEEVPRWLASSCGDTQGSEGILEGYARKTVLSMFASPVLQPTKRPYPAPAEVQRRGRGALHSPALETLELAALGLRISQEAVGSDKTAWQVRSLTPGSSAAASGLICVGDFLWEIEGTCISMNGTSSLGVLACMASRTGKAGECRIGVRGASKWVSAMPTRKISLQPLVRRSDVIETSVQGKGAVTERPIVIDLNFDSPGHSKTLLITSDILESTGKKMTRWHAQTCAIEKALVARDSLLSYEQVAELSAMYRDLASNYRLAHQDWYAIFCFGAILECISALRGSVLTIRR